MCNGLFKGLNERSRAALRSGDFRVQQVRARAGLPSLSYRTIFGPAFGHRGVVYCTSSANLHLASYRLFHDKVGVSALHARQCVLFSSIFVKVWEADYKERLRARLQDVPYFVEANAESVEAPHPKRALRRAAWESLRRTGCEGNPDSNYLSKKVQLNLKPLEWAKDKKNGRIVCDLSTPASIRGGWLMDAMKEVLEMEEDQVRLGRSVFVKSPNVGRLSALFLRMLSENLCLYFSDDSTYSLVTLDGMLYFNVDISGCDASQSKFVFLSLLAMTPDAHRPTMLALLSQCAAACKLGYGPGALSFIPVDYFEYSGSLLTTMLNNIATLHTSRGLFRGYTVRSKKEAIAYVTEYFDNAPWKFTVEFCESIYGVQFLKCSPARTVTGGIVACLNLGVILRCMGQRSGDLPGRGDLQRRAFIFNAGLVRGMVHAGNHQLLRLLQRKFLSQDVVDVQYNSNSVKFLEGGLSDEIDDLSICERYCISIGDYHTLLTMIDQAGFGDVIICTASKAIIALDYGL